MLNVSYQVVPPEHFLIVLQVKSFRSGGGKAASRQNLQLSVVDVIVALEASIGWSFAVSRKSCNIIKRGKAVRKPGTNLPNTVYIVRQVGYCPYAQ